MAMQAENMDYDKLKELVSIYIYTVYIYIYIYT